MKKLALLLLPLLALLPPARAANPLQGYPTATVPNSDDWIYIAGNTYSVRKLSPLYYIPATTAPVTNDLLWYNGTNWANLLIGANLTVSGGVLNASGSSAIWGNITGTLANQGDLSTALTARLVAASNLSDLASAATARTNLGLGTAATQASSYFQQALSVTAPVTLTGTTIALASQSLTPGTYGNTSNIPQVTVNQQGVITGISNVSVSTGGVTNVSSANANITVASPTTTPVLTLASVISSLNSITAAASTDLTLNAGSGNQNVVLNPTGTGTVKLPDYAGNVLKVGTGSFVGQDNSISINRIWGNGSLGAGASGHGFADESTLTRTGGSAYDSFAVATTLSGNANYNHDGSFQAAPTIAIGANTLTTLFGYTFRATYTSGTTTNTYPFWIQAPTGASGGTNWAFRDDDGNALSYLAGGLQLPASANLYLDGATGLKMSTGSNTLSIVAADPGTARTVTLPSPGGSGMSFVYDQNAQTLSNKTIAGLVATGTTTSMDVDAELLRPKLALPG